MTAELATSEPIRFHLSLNVPDLERAVGFYSVLFGMPATKKHDDYAKFDLVDPPVVFSLAPMTPGPGRSLSHLGLRVSSDETIAEFRERMEQAGIPCECQDGTTCGYARQNKLWIQDPFGNFWEVYHIEEDVLPEKIRTTIEGRSARIDQPSESVSPVSESTTWEHFITSPLPERIAHEDESLDEVRLTGTFNGTLTEERIADLLRETKRALRPGGRVVTHGLMANKSFGGGNPKLPGLAAMVSRVPVQDEPIEALRRAGFVGITFTKYTEKAWFVHQCAELREVKISAHKPMSVSSEENRQILYKGPFSRVTADGGLVLQRGQRTLVPAATWEQLRLGAEAEKFLFFEPGAGVQCSTSC